MMIIQYLNKYQKYKSNIIVRLLNSINNKRECIIYNISSKLIDYELAWKYQKALTEHCYRNKINNNISIDSMILLQHSSIYTLGKGSTIDNIKFVNNNNNNSKEKHNVVRIERGGEVTWHGPGQLVVYPIFDLNYHKKDLHWFTNSLESVIINMLLNYRINANRLDINTGVWVNKNKICAIGISATRWITYHGLALNVNSNLKYYNNIIPCGINNNEYGVCSIQSCNENYKDINIDKNITNIFIKSMENIFNIKTIEYDYEESKQKLDDILNLYSDIKNTSLHHLHI